MFPDRVMTEQAEGVTEQGEQAKAVIHEIQSRLAALLSELDPEMVDAQAATSLWDAFDQVERLGSAGKLLVSQRVEASGVARSAGFRDTAEYLARRSGCSRRAARRQIQTSEKLTHLPDTAAAVRGGALSADQAAAIADAAAADSEAEPGLLTMANRVSLKELQDACLRVKAKADPNPDKTRRRHQRERFLRHGIEDRFRARTRTGDDGDGGLDSYDQRAYDALFDILRTHIAEGPFADLSDDTFVGTNDDSGGSGRDGGERGGYHDDRGPATRPEPSDATGGLAGMPSRHGQLPLAAVGPSGPDRASGAAPAGPEAATRDICDRCGRHIPPTHHSGTTPPDRRRKRKRRQPNPVYTTLIRIDVGALNRGWQGGDEVCDMPGLGPVSVPAVRALLPDSIIRLILTRGEEVAAVVHAGRGPNTAQKMALNWLQPICTVEGCNSQIVQADHRIDWATTHHTTLSQLDHLCPHHHGLKTQKGWALVGGTGKRAFVPPGDPQHPLRKHQPDHSSRQAAA